jgi:Uma2 family endonuclease
VVLSEHDEPQPDVAVLLPSAEDHDGNALPEDVYFVIEVADSSLRHDRSDKLPRYARAGIAEVWIVDVDSEIVSKHLDPLGEHYTRIITAQRGDVVQSTTLPVVTVDVQWLLPWAR